MLATAAYDVVTLFDVLEHLPDPLRALVRLRRTLRPGGLIAVTVPDFGGAWARLSGRHWPFVTPWEHLVYFSRRTLARALGAAGFVRVRFHATATPLPTRVLAARLPPAVRGLAPRWIAGVDLPAGTLFALAEAPRP